MNSITNAYAAGLIDGEGTVTLMKQARAQRRSPVISVSSTTKELVDFMKSNFGGHIVTLKPTQFKQAYHWQCSHNTALACLEQVAPFLREPEKKRRAELLLSRYKSVTPRNGKYSDELETEKQAFELEFFGS
jgi:hypothetical protein